MAQKICKRRNHFVLLHREREINIVPRKYSSGINPELISVETYQMKSWRAMV
jgi:hypothetical protein